MDVVFADDQMCVRTIGLMSHFQFAHVDVIANEKEDAKIREILRK